MMLDKLGVKRYFVSRINGKLRYSVEWEDAPTEVQKLAFFIFLASLFRNRTKKGS